MEGNGKNLSADVKQLKKRISDIIGLAVKYNKDETQKCLDLFDTVTKAATNSSSLYTKYSMETLDTINRLTRQAQTARKTQIAEMEKDYQMKVKDNEFIPDLTDCVENLDKILRELEKITEKSGQIADFISPLMGKHTDLLQKFFNYRDYWSKTKVKNKYDKITSRLKLILEVNIPNNVNSPNLEEFIKQKQEKIDQFEKDMNDKHVKHQNLLSGLQNAYKKGNIYARTELRRKIAEKKISDASNMSEPETQDPTLQKGKEKTKRLTLLQRSIRAQLNEFKKMSTDRVSKPECLKSSRALNLKGVKKHVLIGKPLFYMMGILNGLKLVVGLLQKKIVPLLSGYEKEIFENKHRRRALARKITKKTTSLTIQVISLTGSLTGIGAGICGALGEIYEMAASVLWLVNGAMYSIGNCVSPALDKDSDELQEELDNLAENFKDLSEISDENAFEKYFAEWKSTGKISLPSEN